MKKRHVIATLGVALAAYRYAEPLRHKLMYKLGTPGFPEETDDEERVSTALRRGIEATVEDTDDEDYGHDWITVQNLLGDVDVGEQTYPHQQAESEEDDPNTFGWQPGPDGEPRLPTGQPVFPEEQEAYRDLTLPEILAEEGAMTAEELAEALCPSDHLGEEFAPFLEVLLEKWEEAGRVTQLDDGRYEYHG